MTLKPGGGRFVGREKLAGGRAAKYGDREAGEGRPGRVSGTPRWLSQSFLIFEMRCLAFSLLEEPVCLA